MWVVSTTPSFFVISHREEPHGSGFPVCFAFPSWLEDPVRYLVVVGHVLAVRRPRCCSHVAAYSVFPHQSLEVQAHEASAPHLVFRADVPLVASRASMIRGLRDCEIGRRGQEKRGALAGLRALWAVPN